MVFSVTVQPDDSLRRMCKGISRGYPVPKLLALFDAFGSAEETLHANRGEHGDLPRFETDSSLRFFLSALPMLIMARNVANVESGTSLPFAPVTYICVS